jgi:hypothetical protein
MKLKARLHLQFLLRFLVRCSPSDACDRVDELRIFGARVPNLNIHNSSTRSHPSEEENRSKNCKCKQALRQARLREQAYASF